MPIRELWMTVATDQAEILAPVRYLNFGTEYIQPLSGYILWDHYQVGYLGVHYDGAWTIKLALAEPTSIFRMHNTRKSGKLAKILPNLLLADAFVGLRELRGDVTFHHVKP